MEQAIFGNSGKKVSRLGFGAMRLPLLPDKTVDFDYAIPMLQYAFEHGVTFFDTHHFYLNGQSEEALGRALSSYPRNEYILQTKVGMYHDYKESQIWDLLETALKKMKTEYIDFYLSHSLTWETHLKFRKLFLKVTDKAIAQGLIKHRGFSVHDSPENIEKLILTGDFSSITLQYNLLDRKNEKAISLAKEKGLGVSVMGPVAGGMLGEASGTVESFASTHTMSTAALALKFVASNPSVHVALSGMSAMEQVVENCALFSDSPRLDPSELLTLNNMFEERKKLLDLYCTGCSYCMPCPNNVSIPGIFHLYNLAHALGISKKATARYRSISVEQNADACIACGVCLPKCPQKIDIPKRLAEVAKYFSEQP
ncbi:MAG: aldo/keto reductase [Candidatus Ratteibacteria bacterium]|jgi:predicted aldo/keto reductase-like oxidoreductase